MANCKIMLPSSCYCPCPMPISCASACLPGPPGPQGPQGIPGPAGPPGPEAPTTGYNIVTAAQSSQSITFGNRYVPISFDSTQLDINPKVERIDNARFRILENGTYNIYFRGSSEFPNYSSVSYGLFVNGSVWQLTRVRVGSQDNGIKYVPFSSLTTLSLTAGDELYVAPDFANWYPENTIELADAYIQFEKRSD